VLAYIISDCNNNKKLNCRWQTARRISTNAMAWVTS